MADQGSSPPIQETTRTQLTESLDKKIQSSTNNFDSLKNFGRTWASFIYRIPAEIRELNESAYTPSIVSIGPFHRDAEHLQAMEVDKLSYMQSLFFRFEDYYTTRERCMDAMLHAESEQRTWYAELQIRADNEEAERVKFAEMMLNDGCFIIELLYRNYMRSQPYPFTYMIPDPILDNYSMRSAVQHDLILLENQIPFSVLGQLFNLTVLEENIPIVGSTLQNLIFVFFKDMMGMLRTPSWDLANPPFHLLDFLHSCYIASVPLFPVDTKQPVFKYSATRLDLAGVKLKPGSETSLFDIKFSTIDSCFQAFRSGCFEIPPFPITSSTEPLLRNLIATEQFCLAPKRHFTSHAFLMNKLINTAKDVDLLVEAGVIHNYLGSSEEVAQLYNNICKNVHVGGFYFHHPCRQVTNYCQLFWPRCVAKLKRDYFGNPWTGISVFAAIFIFVLSSLQTVYTILSFYDKK